MSLHISPFTLGIEEEYQIIEPGTGQLTSVADLILPEARKTLGEAVQYEMILSQIEVATPICSTLHEAKDALTFLRAGVINAAEKAGTQIGAAGLHPYSDWADQQITKKPRYEQLINTFQQLLHQQTIFGLHVHVGIPDREVAIQVLNHARLWLSPLIALSASSPFHLGKETGYEQFRSSLWLASPLSGPPPAFHAYSDYQVAIQEFVETGIITDATQVYWDLRLSERFDTIEFRVMDACTRLNDTITLAGLIRGLVQTCYNQVMQKIYAPTVSSDFLRLAQWQASRYGLRGNLTNTITRQQYPALELVERMLEFVRPTLEALDDWQTVNDGIHQIFDDSTSAHRQRMVYTQTAHLSEVVKMIVAETRSF